MRYLLLSFAAVLLTGIAGAAAATDAPRPTGIKRTVYLDHLALQEMKKSNPDRYAQVRKVMASASELCAPNAARQWSVANVSAASCSGAFLKMSFPPKREIGFQIDDTWYVALVTLYDKPALRAAEPGRVIPVEQAK